MSLRIKLPLFTALFVFLASIAILFISIHQTVERRDKDIARVELLGMQNPASAGILAMRVEEIKENTKEIIRDRIFFSAVLLVICVVVIFIFSQSITSPVKRLVTLAEEITAGRKNYSERIVLKTTDEIGRLAGSFNTLLQHTENSFTKVKESAEKYRELIENANSAIIRIDENGRAVFFNEYAQELFGYSPAEVIGIFLSDTIGKPIGPEQQSMFEMLKNNRYIELEHRAKNGGYQPVDM